MTTSRARVAVVGIALESNAFAPVTTEADFRLGLYLEGDALATVLRAGTIDAFCARMDELRDWTLVPILLAAAEAGGPCDHEFYTRCLARLEAGLRAAAPVDGVYVIGHGAGRTTRLDDLDGDYLATVRAIVGRDVPIVATTDLHANVSDAMIDGVDVLIGYRTNPHVDVLERSREAAEHMHDLLARRWRPERSFLRLPLVTPQVAQLTAPDQPLGELIDHGQRHAGPDIANVSIWPGFAFTDSRHNGFAILVTARGSRAAADALARDLAERAWRMRSRFVARTIDLDAAARIAVEAGRNPGAGPVVLADVADNPGGGGRGNTMWLVERLYAAGARGVQIGVIWDPELAAEACALGAGAEFVARFNRTEAPPFSLGFAAPARIAAAATHVRFVGTQGMARGLAIDLGAACVLEIGGLSVVVASIRQQVLGPEAFDHAGLDSRRACTFVVKSRGHFRAGFAGLVADERIHEVDAPGLTTPNLASVPWRELPRPVHPLDPDVRWPA